MVNLDKENTDFELHRKLHVFELRSFRGLVALVSSLTTNVIIVLYTLKCAESNSIEYCRVLLSWLGFVLY